MEIQSVQFIKGVVGEEAIMYDSTPHIAFVGRSNVGKSSTLNALFSTKKMVKIGKTPGKTKEINFFRVITKNEGNFYFVDLPGYGYAKLSKNDRLKLEKLIQWYLGHPQADTALVCIVIDAQVGITDFDRAVMTQLKEQGKAYIVLVNKIDRLNQKERSTLQKTLEHDLDRNNYVMYAAKSGKHIDRVREMLKIADPEESLR